MSIETLQVPGWLPMAVKQQDLLHAFFWYVSSYFALSIVLRFQMYRGIYRVARHVRESCPNLWQLLSEHWWMLLQNGLMSIAAVYGVIMIIYVGLNHLVWPHAHISLLELSQYDASHVAWCLVLIGLMLTIDLILLCRVAVFDPQRVVRDLNFAEGWLGGHLNSWLDVLGTWNPIRFYARKQARENVIWFNQMFRTNLSAMTMQLVVRIAVAFVLFANSTEVQRALMGQPGS